MGTPALLESDPAVQQTTCFGERLIDGINAVPLAKDPDGGRRGNVEADMLLLTQNSGGSRLVLVEAKTTSNNAWYAAVENLRQLRLFQASGTAQAIMSHRSGSELLDKPPITAVVLAPATFYVATGARARSVPPARQLISQVSTELEIDMRLGLWDLSKRTVSSLAT